MGSLFKVLAVSEPHLAGLAGFEPTPGDAEDEAP
jgi:hypothetical protein